MLRLAKEAGAVYVTLLKIMVPALLVVKALELIGVTRWLAVALAPVMGALGLPESFSIVWATTLMTNIFTGIVVFSEVAAGDPVTVAQVSVLGALMLMGHALPVEGAVAKRAGVPWWLTLALRIGGGFVLGWLLHQGYEATGTLQQANRLAWQPERPDAGLSAWLWFQGRTLGGIYFIILGLMVLLAVLRRLGIERLMHTLLGPPLRVLGIGREAANTTVIGLTLGLSYGAGLLIRDTDSGALGPRDAYLTLCFLGLCHSLIEDTLLIALIGADLSAVLWGRLVMAFALVGLIARFKPGDRLDDAVEADG